VFLITFNDFLLFSAAKIMIVFDILVRQHSVFCKTLIFLKMMVCKIILLQQLLYNKSPLKEKAIKL